MTTKIEYNPGEIEPRWQQTWEELGLHRASETGNKPKLYCLDYFPYPSGEGLHVGHCRNYVPTDVISRYKRMQGYNVLHPMGWDAFGEPAEQNAVKNNITPRVGHGSQYCQLQAPNAADRYQLRLESGNRFFTS